MKDKIPSNQKDGRTVIRRITDPVTADYTVVRDLPYGADREQNMDVYLPDDAHSATDNYTIVFLHGGGFYFSDKSKEEQFIKPYLKEKFTVVNLNYRRRRGVPLAVSDLPLALDFLKNQRLDKRLNLTKIVLAGFSAGAQIASLVGYGTNHKKFNYRLSEGIKISAVINIAGPVADLDIVEQGFLQHADEPMQEIGKAMFPTYPGATPKNVMREFEAIHYFDRDGPAFFLWYGGQDDQIPPSSFSGLLKKLRPNKDQAYFAAQAGHVPGAEEIAAVYPHIFNFLKNL